MKTRVFAYKGYVGAETDLENGVFLNDPMKTGQCGCIVSVDELEITQEAIDLIRTARTGCDDIADIMLGKDHICLLGFGHHLISLELTPSCDRTLLDRLAPVELTIDPEFIEYIDSLITKGADKIAQTGEKQ
jgi:hypothetical protein